MKEVILNNKKDLRIIDLPKPKCYSNDILVKISQLKLIFDMRCGGKDVKIDNLIMFGGGIRSYVWKHSRGYFRLSRVHLY
ncbi:MAG: hypothetical protein QG670_1133 [Thermoproteota archaeon]|nr:hypothetical protein [Thermoproteota archaeon]